MTSEADSGIVTISSKNREHYQPIEVHELIICTSELTALLAKRSGMVSSVVDQHKRFPVHLDEREGCVECIEMPLMTFLLQHVGAR
jgi:hypothetical protein